MSTFTPNTARRLQQRCDAKKGNHMAGTSDSERGSIYGDPLEQMTPTKKSL